MGGVHQARRVPRDAESFRVGRLVALLRGDAGVQRDRRDEHAARDELGDQLRREGSPRARHLGATGLSCVDVSVSGERPAPAARSRTESVARAREVVSSAAADRGARARAAGRHTGRGSAPSRRPGAPGPPRPRRRRTARRRGVAPRSSSGRVAAGRRGGEPELELGSVGAHRRHGRGKGGRRVDDEEIAWSEEPRQVAKAAWTMLPSSERRRAGERGRGNAASLWRLVRLEADGQSTALMPTPPPGHGLDRGRSAGRSR